MDRDYYVYIMTNKTNTVLYTGITNNLTRRVWEHKEKLVKGFSQRYNVTKLVYFEAFQDPLNAITREKQIKGGSRKKKNRLITLTNPRWLDLYESL